jgi:carotenoid 1,2-hydratase
VPPGGYLWWYIDALSDDGQYGLSIIAFVGSVFSPYYAWARARSGGCAPAENFCALNVALYGPRVGRWAMTERGRTQISRSASEYRVGPSSVRWDGQSLLVDIDEVAVPIPRRVRGRVRVTPHGLCTFVTPLDNAGRHHWGPIAPCASVQVDMEAPAHAWKGHAYLDSNQGAEPIDAPFVEWDWSRATLADGSCAVIYDVRQKQGADRVIAQRFSDNGDAQSFEAPPRHALPRSAWGLARTQRSAQDSPPRILRSLEDTPFYARAVLQTRLLGESVTSVHETLDLARLTSLPVRLMLPWRMPRRA